ncbi:MAG: pilus assembly FimT family protein, partial [Gammaproteobacteria bacterium]
MPNRSHERGVTVIELMVTIVVLAILAAIAYPNFTRMLEQRRMVGAAENIFALLQYAKTESIKRNRVVNVQFDDAMWCLGLDDTPASACDCDAAPGNCTVNG